MGLPRPCLMYSFAVNLGDHPLSRDREPRHPGWGCGHDGVDGVVGSLGLGVLNQGHQLIVNREQNRDALIRDPQLVLGQHVAGNALREVLGDVRAPGATPF